MEWLRQLVLWESQDSHNPVNGNDPADIKKVNAIQDQIKLEQASAGKFEIPSWDRPDIAGSQGSGGTRWLGGCLFRSERACGKAANWIPTKNGQSFFLLFRFYGPEKALVDRSWTGNDLKVVN